MARNASEKMLEFTVDIAEGTQTADVMIAVGTPDKSTVPAGIAMAVAARVRAHQQAAIDFDVVSNPEFLLEGSAVDDALHPDLIVICAGSELKFYDPVAMEHARPFLPQAVKYCRSALEAAAGADGLVVVTEWDEFKSLLLSRLRQSMRRAVVFDGGTYGTRSGCMVSDSSTTQWAGSLRCHSRRRGDGLRFRGAGARRP